MYENKGAVRIASPHIPPHAHRGRRVAMADFLDDIVVARARLVSPVYYFCHIDPAWSDEYPAGIHQTRDHAGDFSPKEIPTPACASWWDGLVWRVEE